MERTLLEKALFQKLHSLGHHSPLKTHQELMLACHVAQGHSQLHPMGDQNQKGIMTILWL